MVDREALAARLRAMFAEELDEQIRELNAHLIALERTPGDTERVRAVFRVLHTLKGAARAAGVANVEELSHGLEGRLAPARTEGISADLLAALFAAADELAATRDRLLGQAAPTVAASPPREVPQEKPDEPPRTVAIAAPSPQSAPAATSSADVRIDASKLDALLGYVSSVLSLTDRLDTHADTVDALSDSLGRDNAETRGVMQLARSLRRDVRSLDLTASRLGGAVRALRLRPMHDLSEMLPRAARDLAASLGKDVEVVVDGADVEADRAVLAALREPMLHLLRNAIDHGIEAPAVRERAGKPRRGTITVTASVTGDRLRIEMRDDGAGVDESAVRSASQRRGGGALRDQDDVANALFDSGLSTRSEVTTVSGRGVGLDVVRNAVARLGGTVDVGWRRGEGTWFIVETPLTLAVLRALVFRVGRQAFAVPTGAIDRLLRVKRANLRVVDGGVMLPAREVNRVDVDGPPLPVLSLARLLGPPLVERAIEERTPALVFVAGGRRVVVLVDELVEERELVIRPLERVGRAGWRYSGAAAIGDGSLVLLLNVAALLGAASSVRSSGARMPEPSATAKRVVRVLVADDSITTRALEESVLSAAGYAVQTAVDGMDAWERVQAGGFDIVVSDVEMPRLDGFGLCETIRADERFRALPLVLVTSLDAPEHRARGLAVGADAYITKSSFDQENLLDVVRQLVGRAGAPTR